MFAEAIAMFFVAQSGLSGSEYARDMPGYSSENFLLANRIQAIMFVNGLQNAIKRDDRSAVTASVRLPLRVNGPRSYQVRYYRTQSDVLRDYDRIFQAPVLNAIAGQDPGYLSMLDGNYMVGNGDVWFGQACLDKFCDDMSRFGIFTINKS